MARPATATVADLATSMNYQLNGDPAGSARIGELLLQRRLINPAQLAAAIAQQQHDKRRLGAILVSQQLVTERQLHRTLRWQHWLRQAVAASTLSFGCLTATADEPAPSLNFAPDENQIGRLTEAAANWQPGQRPSINRDRLGEPRNEERRRNRFEQQLRDGIGDTAVIVLKGEYSGGVDRYQDGLRYTAKWTDDSVKLELKYYF